MPEDETVGFFSRFWDKIWQPVPSLLVLGAIVAVLFGAISSKHMNKIGEGFTIIVTLLIVCALDAWTAKRCEDGIKEMIRANTVQDIKVIRGSDSKDVKANQLVVGDVYFIEQGMMIPADSILIECSEHANLETQFKFRSQTSETSLPPTLTLNELEVTGLRAYVPKRPISSETAGSTDKSNVLFAKSHVVSGHGKAVVCAVGQYTQAGMPCSRINEEAIGGIEEETRLQGLLQGYTRNMTTVANAIMMILLIMFVGQKVLLPRQEARNRSAGTDVEEVLEELAVMITLVFAFLPEADSLANQTCIRNYNFQPIFKKGKIIYNRQNSLELMG